MRSLLVPRERPSRTPGRFRKIVRRLGRPLAALVLAVSPAAQALDPEIPLTRFLVDVWQAEQGLPLNTITAVHRARGGYLWVGTEEGLVRFDGVRFTVYDRRNTPGMVNHSISALAEERDGTLWAGTDGGGLIRIAPDGLISIPTAAGEGGGGYVRSLYPSSQGGIWAGTDRGVFHIAGVTARHVFGKAEGLPSEAVRSVLEDSKGRLWVGTDSGLLLREGSTLSHITSRDGLLSDWVSSLLEDSSGAIWAGTSRGISRNTGSRFEPVCAVAACRTQVWAMGSDSSGAVYAATSGGVVRFWKKDVSILDHESGLPRDRVYCLSNDAEGSLWLGTDGGGLCRLKLGRFENITKRDGLPDDFINTVFEDSEGLIWIGTPKGLSQLDRSGAVRSFAGAPGLAARDIRTLGETLKGPLWVGTQGGGVGTFSGGRFERAGAIPDNNATCLLPAVDGSLWIGTFRGLFHLRGKEARGFSKADGLPSDEVFSATFDAAGSLWLGTYGGGLVEMKDGHFRTYKLEDGLPSNTVTTLLADGDGSLWIGTVGGGLARRAKGRFDVFDSRRGLCDDTAFQIVDDGAGSLWTTSNRGIARTSRESLLAVASGSRARVDCQLFGLADGLRTRECNGGQQPAGIRSSDGRLFFATARGLAVFDPRRSPGNEDPPPVVLEEIRVRGKSRSLPSGGLLHLAPGENDLEIRYAGLNLLFPDRVRFRYRLEGYDSEWVEAGPRRVAFYTGVPPGRYVFQVGAASGDSAWTPGGATLVVELQPRFFQTKWFFLLVGLSLAATGATLNQIRNRAIRRRAAELERVVEDRTHDLKTANERLEKANEQIARMTESGFRAMDDLSGWADRMAADLATALKLAKVRVFAVTENGLQPVGSVRDGERLTVQDVKKASSGPVFRAGRPTAVPIRTSYGELLGAVSLPARAEAFSNAEERLVLGFAHQLGATLELKQTREDLARAMSVKTARKQELVERGVDVLEICPVCQRCYSHQTGACPADGATLVPPAAFLPYRLNGKYRLQRVLGEGGMGTVFEAIDERLDRSVAVKVMRLDRFADRETLLRFQREARTLAQIDHPGVIAVFDTGELEEGSTFIVMELLKGVDLATLLRTFGRGTPAQVARLLEQSASGLEAAHRQRIVHRDIKPENIILTDGADGFQTKIVDFGLAKKIDAEGMTRTGMVVGSPHYMSPEQARGKPAGPLSDFYSLGVVVYEALTGRKAVDVGDASDIGSILYEVMITVPPPPSVFADGLPPEVDRLLLWSLAKDPEARPRNASEWVPELARLLRTAETSVPGWPEEMGAIGAPRSSTSSSPRTRVL